MYKSNCNCSMLSNPVNVYFTGEICVHLRALYTYRFTDNNNYSYSYTN